MHDLLRFRQRLFTSLVSSGLVVSASVAGCGGQTSDAGQSNASAGSGGAGGGGGGTAGSAGVSTSAGGSESTPTPIAGTGGAVSAAGATGTAGVAGAPAFDAGVDAEPPPPVCDWGTIEYSCMPVEMAISYAGSNDWGGDEPADVELAPNGCPTRAGMQDGCCNPALTEPERKGDECCYDFCTGGCCGRPFLVEGAARSAELVLSDSWCRDVDEPPSQASLARRIADAWRADGLLEHASIAAFNRFSLQLLSLGAPRELLRDAQRAGVDEVEHAQGCFELAASIDGRSLSPGVLSVDGAIAPETLAQIAASAVREGCVEETVAACIAREQSARATQPAARQLLERITNDEERHSELAWRFVAWALQRGGASVAAAVEQAFDSALRDRPFTPQTRVAPEELDRWHAHGRLTADELAAVRSATIRTVVEPLRAALTTREGLDGASSLHLESSSGHTTLIATS